MNINDMDIQTALKALKADVAKPQPETQEDIERFKRAKEFFNEFGI